MEEKEYILLDTRAFDQVLKEKQNLISTYSRINEEYDRIIMTLSDNWKGQGATAFLEDAHIVKSNIVSIFDILKIMCDTLTDCKEIFLECDKALENYNREHK